jgi:hypothetical protein
MKKVFENELVLGMQAQMRKQASAEKPNLVQAAECLHSALEILESHGLTARADQVLSLLQKIAQTNEVKDMQEMPTLQKLMEAGMTQRDLHEFSKGSPIAKAKLNLVLRSLGLSDHHMAKFLGPTNVMSEDDAKHLLDPNRSFSKMWDWMENPTKPANPENVQPGETLEFKSIAQKKRSVNDPHTHGLTPEKEVENLKNHGTPFNMADDGDCGVEVHPPVHKGNLKDEDMEPDFAELLKSPSFDIDASDDELMGMEIKEDSLEVFEKDIPMEDFEDERD